MNRSLILIGDGGHCKSVINIAESAGYNILGILDTAEHIGKKVLNYEVIGTDEDIDRFIDYASFIVTIGHIKDASLRIKLHEEIMRKNGTLTTLISPTAIVSRYANIEEGSVIMHQAVVNADVHIGKGCIINTFANIEHDSIIGDYVHVSTGTMVNGNCNVGRESFLGSQSAMVNGTSITAGCVIAAGSIVRKDIKIRGIYSGNPALLKVRL